MLEKILQTYFGCETPFSDEPEYSSFSADGAASYEQLIALLVDLEAMGLPLDAEKVISELDKIADLKY